MTAAIEFGNGKRGYKLPAITNQEPIISEGLAYTEAIQDLVLRCEMRIRPKPAGALSMRNHGRIE